MFHIRAKSLLAFNEGHLTPVQKRRIEKHLSICEKCQKKKQDLDQITNALKPEETGAGQSLISSTKSESCCSPEDLFQYYQGTLPAEKKEGIKDHLLHCDFCYEALDGFAEEQLQATPAPCLSQSKKATFKGFRPLSLPLSISSAAVAMAMIMLIMWQLPSPLSYDFSITAQRRNKVRSNNTFTLPAAGTLYSGDKFRIEITPKEDLFLYAFLYTSTGNAQTLFPALDVPMENHLNKNKSYSIPSGGFWPLDQNKGQEIIFLVSSTQPLKGIDNIPKELERATTDATDKTKRLELAEKYMKNRFKGVQTFSFNHQ